MIEKKGNKYYFDVVLSVGITCRPAHYLQKHGLRSYANPLDWMMSYSLDTVIHLFESKFNDFFVDFVEYEKVPNVFIDVKNDIVSIHYPEIGKDCKAFNDKMRNRFKKIDGILQGANKICFVSNRNENHRTFFRFFKKMGAIYSGEITLINIKNNENIDEIIAPTKYVTERISERFELIEYEFNDIHPNGAEESSNPDFWHGNVRLWDRIIKKIIVK